MFSTTLIANRGEITCRIIAALRISREGQEGLSAFLEKRKPEWIESSGQG